MRKLVPLPMLVLALALPVESMAQPQVSVTGAWIRLLPGNLPLAGYFTLHNDGSKTIKLVGATSPAFERIEVHHSMTAESMDTMTSVQSVAISAGTTFAFAPGGYHLMLWRRHTLQVGEKIPVTLKLAGGGELRAVFVVEPTTHD